MKKRYIIAVIGIILIIICGWLVFSNQLDQVFFKKEVEVSNETIKKEVFLVIDDAQGPPKSFKTQFQEKMTAFDLLSRGAENLSLTLETKTYDIGIFIEAIGGIKNGKDSKYWMYYVNGELPMVSADKEELKSGDAVEFKFEKSQF